MRVLPISMKGGYVMPDKESSQSTQSAQRQKGTEQKQPLQEKQTNGKSGQQHQTPARRDWFTPSLWMENPFTMMQRLSTEIDRLFDTFSRGGGFSSSHFGRSGESRWLPEI
jgi:hypothetical protein